MIFRPTPDDIEYLGKVLSILRATLRGLESTPQLPRIDEGIESGLRSLSNRPRNRRTRSWRFYAKRRIAEDLEQLLKTTSSHMCSAHIGKIAVRCFVEIKKRNPSFDEVIVPIGKLLEALRTFSTKKGGKALCRAVAEAVPFFENEIRRLRPLLKRRSNRHKLDVVLDPKQARRVDLFAPSGRRRAHTIATMQNVPSERL